MPAMLDRLRTDFTQSTDRYRALEDLITGEDREPTEVEQGELEDLQRLAAEHGVQVHTASTA